MGGGWGFKEIQKYSKSQPWIWQWFGYDAKGISTKEKSDKVNFMKILKICISKDTRDRATHRLRENICKSYMWLQINIQHILRTPEIQQQKIPYPKKIHD